MILTLSTPPSNFIAYNQMLSKQLNVVVDIAGLPLISSLQTERFVNYGDAGVLYGGAGLTYGGLVPVGFNIAGGERQQKNLLILDQSSLSIQQRLEPEQGRGSISTLTMTFLDKDGYMTKAISPGVILPEILGQQVKVWIGYTQTGWPQDYYVVWRGRVAQTTAEPGRVTMQFVDPNIVRKQQVFYSGQTSLIANIGSGDTQIPVVSTGNFFKKITGPGGGYDGAVRLFIKVDNEFMEYSQTGSEAVGVAPVAFVVTSANATVGAVYKDANGVSYTVTVTIVAGTVLTCTANGTVGVSSGVLTKFSGSGDSSITFSVVGGGFSAVTRGVSPVANMATPSAPAAHSATATVDAYIMLQGHAMDLALKVMLSGWNGPFTTGQSIYSFVTTDDSSLPTVPNGIVLPANTDAIRDLGISVGDYITVTGGANNAVMVTVIGFNDLTNQPNRVILCSSNFTNEDPSTATIAVRSQYDTLPVLAGSQLPGWEVDVGAFQYYKSTFLLNPANQYLFLLNDSNGEAGKTFIESEILYPIGAYSLTRQGKISVGLTKPPVADQRTQTITAAQVLSPETMSIQRALNNRKFFNEIDWSYDCDETNTPTSQRNAISAASLNKFSNYSSVLPITSRGARTSLGFLNVVSNREAWIFNRYQFAAQLLDLKVNLQVGALIEAGDVVILQDNGTLKIPNFATGQRNLGTQFFEVVNRSMDLKSGIVSLTLEGGVGSVVGDRYATVAPSSILTSMSSATRIVIQDSFGAIFPGAEWKKWSSYVGLKVRVHSTDYSVDGTTTFTGFDPNNKYALLLSPALSFGPTAGMVLDLEQYPNNTSASDQASAKMIHAYDCPTVPVVSGISQTQFTVSAPNALKFQIGLPVLFHDATYGRFSGEVIVQSVVGTTVTVATAIGFVPDASIKCELIGFPDGGQPYRLV